MRERQDRRHASRGATTAEYTGVIVIVAAILAAIAITPIGTQVASGLTGAICTITGQTGCQTTTAATGPNGQGTGTGTGTTGSGSNPGSGSGAPGSGAPGTGGPGGSGQGTGGDPASGGPTLADGPTLQIPVEDGPAPCTGVLGCAAKATKGFVKGAWTGARDEVTGTWDLVTHPSQIIDAGKGIWDNPWNSAKQLIWDDESATMADEGNTAGAVGRAGWNVGSWFIPGVNLLKVSKASKISKIAKFAKAAQRLTELAGTAKTAANRAEKAAAAGDKAAADAAAREARKAADDAKQKAKDLGCPIALPPLPGTGGAGRGTPLTVRTLIPRAGTEDCGTAQQAARDAQSDANRAEDAAAATASSAGSTVPSRTPDPQARPGGHTTTIPKKADPETARSLTRENEAADTLAKKGFDVEQNPPPKPNGKEPDYRIEGEYFDAYSPSTNNARNIATGIEKKVLKEQTERVVLDLDDSSVDLAAMRSQLQDWPIIGLKEVIVVRGDQVTHLYP